MGYVIGKGSGKGKDTSEGTALISFTWLMSWMELSLIGC